MNSTFDSRDAARFLRTLRVTTQTAIALSDLDRAGERMRPVSIFTALAAKGIDEWRFPAAGILSGDGLVLARLEHEGDEAKEGDGEFYRQRRAAEAPLGPRGRRGRAG